MRERENAATAAYSALSLSLSRADACTHTCEIIAIGGALVSLSSSLPACCVFPTLPLPRRARAYRSPATSTTLLSLSHTLLCLRVYIYNIHIRLVSVFRERFAAGGDGPEKHITLETRARADISVCADGFLLTLSSNTLN